MSETIPSPLRCLMMLVCGAPPLSTPFDARGEVAHPRLTNEFSRYVRALVAIIVARCKALRQAVKEMQLTLSCFLVTGRLPLAPFLLQPARIQGRFLKGFALFFFFPLPFSLFATRFSFPLPREGDLCASHLRVTLLQCFVSDDGKRRAGGIGRRKGRSKNRFRYSPAIASACGPCPAHSSSSSGYLRGSRCCRLAMWQLL